MARVTGGMTTRRRHKKILKLAKGYRGGKSKLFRVANQAVMKSLVYVLRTAGFSAHGQRNILLLLKRYMTKYAPNTAKISAKSSLWELPPADISLGSF